MSFHFVRDTSVYHLGFPGGADGKEFDCQCRRCKKCRFKPWVRKISWRRARKPTPVCLPGESHGQRSLAGYKSTWSQRVEHDWSNLACTHLCVLGFNHAFQLLMRGLNINQPWDWLISPAPDPENWRVSVLVSTIMSDESMISKHFILCLL